MRAGKPLPCVRVNEHHHDRDSRAPRAERLLVGTRIVAPMRHAPNLQLELDPVMFIAQPNASRGIDTTRRLCSPLRKTLVFSKLIAMNQNDSYHAGRGQQLTQLIATVAMVGIVTPGMTACRSGGTTRGSGAATGGSGTATSRVGSATDGAGGSSSSGAANSKPGFVIGLDGIAAFDAMSSADKDALKNTKVFFQHMSVGENLIMGYNNWSPPWHGGTNSLGFVFHSVNSASDYNNVKLGDKAFGYNGNPFNKINGFKNHILDLNIGTAVKVAGFKYCYNDLTIDTTATGDDVISAYQSAFQQIESRTSEVSFIHVTTAFQPANQWQTGANNTLRAKFGDFLRNHYAGGRHVVFDLQQIESTGANGQKCSQNGIPVLCAEWAADNDGHLNNEGATRAAKAFVYALHVARSL